jgi:hypothetical protein
VAKKESLRTSAVIKDSQIVIPAWVLQKLTAQGQSASRVRQKVRHLLQSLLDRGLTGDWVAIFGNDAKLCRRSAPSPGEDEDRWRTAMVMGRRRPTDLSGILFRRRCFDNVFPTPENERKAKKNAHPATDVELGVVVKKLGTDYEFTVFRFSEQAEVEAFNQ